MRNKATKKNMDLDLRRYGSKLYTKAEQSGGSGGGDEGGDADSIVDAMTDFKITIKKDKSGFFSIDGRPVDCTVYADQYYSSGVPDITDNLASLEEYFDISDIDVFRGLCGLLQNVDKTITSGDCPELTLILEEQDLLGYNQSSISGTITLKVYDDNGTLSDYLEIIWKESGTASSYFPEIDLFLDPTDPTKFYAKPTE